MLRRVFPSFLVLVLGLFTLLAVGAPAQAAPVTVTNGTQFTDTTGAVVHAHGGGVIKVGAYLSTVTTPGGAASARRPVRRPGT